MRDTRELCPFGIESERNRKAIGLSKAELCRRAGISQQFYDYIIHGQRKGEKDLNGIPPRQKIKNVFVESRREPDVREEVMKRY